MDHKNLIKLAAAYSLGALDEAEKSVFEAHLKTGCDECARLVMSFNTTVGAMGLTAGETRPRPVVKEKILDLIDADSRQTAVQHEPSFLFVFANEGEWIALDKGVTAKILSEDHQRKTTTMLIKMAPGSRIASHHHDGAEELFVLEGECHCAGRHLKTGDYHRAAAHSDHDVTTTETGCLMLVIAPLAA